jgi:predicted O-linked N-acetylglucosamine transferase (SPINDLY family)
MIKNKPHETSRPSKEVMKKLETLHALKKFKDLELETTQLILAYPNIASLYNILGFAFHKQKNLKKAASNYEKAVFIDSNFYYAHNNLGNLFKDLKRFDEAIDKYKHAIKLKPDYAEAYYNQGIVYKKIYKYNEAIKSFESALKIRPDYLDAYFDLGQAFVTVGKFEKAIENFEKVINLKPDFTLAYNNIFFTLLYVKKKDHQLFISLAKKFRSSIKNINQNLLIKPKFDVKPKKLRIGFVSGDFWEHPVGYILLGLLKNLKNKNLEIIAYSNFSKKDNFSAKLGSYFHHWHEIGDKGDMEVINQIRNDKINILFDLSGHAAKNRLSVFANKAAPIQISWGSYPGFIGIPEIDYFIGDKYITPKNENKYFIEKVILMPNIWICFTAPDFEVKIKELPAIQNKYITFGSFNNLSKVNAEVVSLWSKIIKAVPKSKIFLKSNVLSDSYFKKEIIENFKKNNISSDSIILEGRSSRNEYLKSYNKVDIALDPFPYSGGITTFEAMWMGVPVLTKKGCNKIVSHQTESINYNSKMSEWVAQDEKDYFDKAIKFASNIDELNFIRKNLRQKTLSLPSYNTSVFSEDFNKLIWKTWNNFINN